MDTAFTNKDWVFLGEIASVITLAGSAAAELLRKKIKYYEEGPYALGLLKKAAVDDVYNAGGYEEVCDLAHHEAEARRFRPDWKALEVLGQFGTPEVAMRVLKIAEDAIFGMTGIVDANAAKRLVYHLEDNASDPEVRKKADQIGRMYAGVDICKR